MSHEIKKLLKLFLPSLCWLIDRGVSHVFPCLIRNKRKQKKVVIVYKKILNFK